jgi:hypothetical protein
MPAVFRESGLRYFFYSNEGSPPEPPHIHIKGRGCDAKIWLEPSILVAKCHGFNSKEIAHILQVVTENLDLIQRAWNEHFGNSGRI